jgi:hypothetical protein
MKALVFGSSLCALTILSGCGKNPMDTNGSVFSLQTPEEGARLLSGDTITVSWLSPRTAVAIDYRFAPGGHTGSDTAWKAMEPLTRSDTELLVVLPLEISDSLLIRAIDRERDDTAGVSGRLNHFILTEYPEPGGSLVVGDTVGISWQASSLVNRAILMLAQEGGMTYGYITGQAAISMPQTNYSWVIGSNDEVDISYPGTDYSVFIIEYDRFEWTDAMPGTFSITN